MISVVVIVYFSPCVMADLYDAAKKGGLKRVKQLLEQGVDKNQVGGHFGHTSLCIAGENNHLDVVRYLVEQGADIEKADRDNQTPLIWASYYGHLEVVRYLLEQGADRDKANNNGYTSLHNAAVNGHLETAKLLMVYGADLNARNNDGQLPIDVAVEEDDEEIEQAIRDEPRRRMDHGHKRATEQDRHPNSAESTSAQEEDEEHEGEEEQSNKRPRLDEGREAGKVAEEDEDSEPSDEEDGN